MRFLRNSKSKHNFFLLLLPLLLVANSFGKNPWVGDYVFVERGMDSLGSTVLINHRIQLFQENGKATCRVHSFGYKTAREHLCEYRVDANSVTLIHSKYGLDQKAKRKIKRGKKLLTLERSDLGLKTNWLDLKPTFRSNNKGGTKQFEKISEEKSDLTREKWINLDFQAGRYSILFPANHYSIRTDEKGKSGRFKGVADRLTVSMSLYHDGSGLLKNLETFQRPRPIWKVVGKVRFRMSPLRLKGFDTFERTIRVKSKSQSLTLFVSGPLKKAHLSSELFKGMSSKGRSPAKVTASIEPTRRKLVDQITTSGGFENILKDDNSGMIRRVTYLSKYLPIRPSIPFSVRNSDNWIGAYIVRRPPVTDYRSNPIVANVELLANGHVGDVVFMSKRTPKKLRPYLRCILGLQFVPAVQDGRFVTSTVPVVWQADSRF